ncbi:nitrate reductase molybdenum cofactor assembly chaperone [Paludibacterium yongneupense]|uniref:nitrate reductase molybdenum cofactor assembly chaperone n=1 Tax=Paludibacterium yongneupense TaxID=400061 RepID=UPI00040C2179|nr:nitrate reductase molybdenum cofactor assembly chaperone [Paludibacterium yongneupense]
MTVHAVLSALLCYPSRELIEALPELDAALDGATRAQLAPLFDTLAEGDLIDLQQDYVAAFDRQRAFSLHLFEHVYGESRERGPAMISLAEEYEKHGFIVAADELPDYLPMFLELLSRIAPAEAGALLGEAIHVIAVIGRSLSEAGNAYACVFDVLVAMSPEAPLPLAVPPVRDMDEMMERFGPAIDGTEPLPAQAPAKVTFYPRTTSGAKP